MAGKAILLLALATAALVFADQAFVGSASNGSLVLRAAPGQHVLMDGLAFQSMVDRLETVERQLAQMEHQCRVMADTTSITGLEKGGGKWNGAVLALNGKIYGIPRFARFTEFLVLQSQC